MNAVQFRVNEGVLEYRCLILWAKDSHKDQPEQTIQVFSNGEYSDWAPVQSKLDAEEDEC